MTSDEQWMYECPFCHEIYNRAEGTGKHTRCENVMARMYQTPKQKMRSQWERMSSRVAPIVFERDGNRCKKCGATKWLTVDHIIPISRGGTNDFNNLQTLCGSCNSKKGGR